MSNQFSIAPQPGKQQIAAQMKVDVMIYGGSAGSGKSRLLLNKAGYYAHTDENFEGVMFRRTTKPLSAAGGLFSEAKKLFRPLGCEIREQAMEIQFHGEDGDKRSPRGGNLKFTHLEHEKDAEGNH